MSDIQLRGVVLQHLYEHRSEYHYQPKPENFYPPMQWLDLVRICDQMQQHGLVDAKIINLLSGDRVMPFCRISARGVDVVETGSSADLRIEFMSNQSNQTINITGSSNVIVGDHNQQSIQHSVQELVRVIESSGATPEKKEEAKGLLRKFLEHPLLVPVAAGAIKLLLQ